MTAELQAPNEGGAARLRRMTVVAKGAEDGDDMLTALMAKETRKVRAELERERASKKIERGELPPP